MSVVSVKERFQSRRSGFSGSTVTHLREWLVKCDDPADGTAAAMLAVPGPGTLHPTDGRCRVTKQDADVHDNSDLHSVVKVEYTGDSTLTAFPSDPLKRPPDIAYGAAEATEAYFTDYTTPNVKRVTNSAGDPFETYQERETGDSILTITVNEATFSPIVTDQYKYTSNQAVVTIDGTEYAAGTLRLTLPTATKVTESVEGGGGTSQPFTYYKVVYTVKARAAGWHDKLDDIGTNELITDPAKPTDPGKLRPIVDSVNAPIKKPWPLSKGRKLADPTKIPDVLEFVPYRPADWSQLKPFQAATWAT